MELLGLVLLEQPVLGRSGQPDPVQLAQLVLVLLVQLDPAQLVPLGPDQSEQPVLVLDYQELGAILNPLLVAAADHPVLAARPLVLVVFEELEPDDCSLEFGE